jgi:hypothetical protein
MDIVHSHYETGGTDLPHVFFKGICAVSPFSLPPHIINDVSIDWISCDEMSGLEVTSGNDGDVIGNVIHAWLADDQLHVVGIVYTNILSGESAVICIIRGDFDKMALNYTCHIKMPDDDGNKLEIHKKLGQVCISTDLNLLITYSNISVVGGPDYQRCVELSNAELLVLLNSEDKEN